MNPSEKLILVRADIFVFDKRVFDIFESQFIS